ncbi:hypothetical protein PspTeo4_13936 [Pseudomonas sp. Teo4]|nr:hypothetical protein [Pseudomonas sp. Teo4]
MLLEDQCALLAHHAAGPGDVDAVAALQLALASRPGDLRDRLDDLRHTTGRAGLAEAELAAVVFMGKSPRQVRSCSRTNAMPSPLPQKPASSRVSKAVMV